MTQLVVDRCVLFFQEFLITAQSCRAFTNWSNHFFLRIMTQWNSFLGIYAGMLDFLSRSHPTMWELLADEQKENSDSSHNHPIFFSLWQGHSIWGRQSHDCAECGNCIRPDSAAARDGVVQHHHAHGLPEPDRGVHPEWIRAHLLLKLKRSQASSADQGKRLNVLKLFEVLDLPLHAHKQL